MGGCGTEWADCSLALVLNVDIVIFEVGGYERKDLPEVKQSGARHFQ